MSGTPPESPEQFRGKTLSPVSPKPLYYPSPSNVPILGASMDPSFSETVDQTMQQQAEPLPSIDQFTTTTFISDAADIANGVKPMVDNAPVPHDAEKGEGGVIGIALE